MITNLQLYNFSRQKNEIIVKIASPNLLSPEKYIFNKDYKINSKRIIDVYDGTNTFRKSCKVYRDFSNSTYVSLKSFDLSFKSKMIFPIFYNTNFECVSCKKIYDKNIKSKCCNLASPIIISSADLKGLYVPPTDDYNYNLNFSKEEFIKLHFPDIFDNIILP